MRPNRKDAESREAEGDDRGDTGPSLEPRAAPGDCVLASREGAMGEPISFMKWELSSNLRVRGPAGGCERCFCGAPPLPTPPPAAPPFPGDVAASTGEDGAGAGGGDPDPTCCVCAASALGRLALLLLDDPGANAMGEYSS